MDEFMGVQTPPYSLEAEQSVLGAMLIDSESLAISIESLDETDFYRPENQKLFSAMLGLFERDVPVDIVTVCEELSKNGDFDAIGGSEFVANIAASVSATENIKYYIEIIQGKSLLRKLIGASSEISKISYEASQPPATVAETAEKLIYDIISGKDTREFSKIGDVLQKSFNRLEELAKLNTRITGLETGFSHLDNLLSGFQPSTLIILAARPGIGKTSFALNIARHVAVKKQVPVAIFSLEMSAEEITNRIISSQALVDSYKLKTGKLGTDDWERMMQSVGPISEAPLYIDDTSTITVSEIRSKCRRLKLEKGLGLVVVDYLQLMQGKRRAESRQQEVSEMSRALKILSKELEVPVLTLSQLSRSIEARKGKDKTPMLSDLRESGAIEQDADIVMFLSRPDEEEEQEQNAVNQVDLVVAKHRSGSTAKIKLAWQPQYTTFVSVDTTYD